ncbi:ABC transporter permease [Sphingomonas mali]|uniref:ABC transporter permease n=1 Tax=Sphingomonas mali TaxID=40682 RepID=UPI00082AAF75|nr:ABC transporter permease [Sphingomonas mali]
MSALSEGWNSQIRVVKALMVRELTTRFGRENIGFLWMMAEPMLFAVLVGVMWTYLKGPEENGIGMIAFVASGYVPLTFLRSSFTRSTSIFVANGSLLYHRQVKVTDFVLVRVLIEFVGATMAWVFISLALGILGYIPVPAYPGMMVAGWLLYGLVVLSVCMVIAPLSVMSEVVEKIMPVSVYIAIPISGTFTMASWAPPSVRDYLLMSPMVNTMEMIRYGLFGDYVEPYYNVWNPILVSIVFLMIGLVLCRRMRRDLVVE